MNQKNDNLHMEKFNFMGKAKLCCFFVFCYLDEDIL